MDLGRDGGDEICAPSSSWSAEEALRSGWAAGEAGQGGPGSGHGHSLEGRVSGCSQALGCLWREPATVLPIRRLPTKAGVLWRTSKLFSEPGGLCPPHPPLQMFWPGRGGAGCNEIKCRMPRYAWISGTPGFQVRLDFRYTWVILGVRTPPGLHGTYLY